MIVDQLQSVQQVISPDENLLILSVFKEKINTPLQNWVN